MLVKDFRELRASVEKMGLLKPNKLFFFLHLAHILLLDTAAWLILFCCGTSFVPFIVSLLVLTISQVSDRVYSVYTCTSINFHTYTIAVFSSLLPYLA